MRFAWYIARRYLFGKKSTNAINLITGISVLGIAIGTAALLLILSVFNGFEGLMKGYLDTFNPDFKIVAKKGKYFHLDSLKVEEIKDLDGIYSISKVIEEVSLMEYDERQLVGVIKGVDDQYGTTTRIDSAIIEGEYRDTHNGDLPYAIIGRGVYDNLNVSINDKYNTLKVFLPNRSRRGMLEKDFKSRSVDVTGVFAINNERDHQYIISDYTLVSDLLEQDGEVSAIEVRSDRGTFPSLKENLQELAGSKFQVLDRIEQDQTQLKIMNIEKWYAYLIFSFVMLLIIFNLIGSLWMIVLEKRKDISVLQSMGANKKMVRNIFIMEGAMISLLGFSIGLAFSLLFYAAQSKYGIIGVPEGFSISSYPMILRFNDVVVILVTVLVLGLVASLPAVIRASKISAYVRVE